MSKRETFYKCSMFIHIPNVYKVLCLCSFICLKKKLSIMPNAHPCPIQYPCLENKFSVSDKSRQVFFSKPSLCYVARGKKNWKKIEICLAFVTLRLPTSVHRKIQSIRFSRLAAQREQKHIYKWFVLLFRFKKYKTLWAWVYAYKILQNTKKDDIIFIFFPWYSIIKIIILLGLICVSLKGK